MIAPLGRYGLRGVAWYQGEANGGLEDAKRYEDLLRGLMADWRRQFGAPLPFLVVQLASWNQLAHVAGGQWLGAAARCAASRGGRGWQCGPGR